MSGVADEDDRVSGAVMALSLDMNFGHQRAGGVEIKQLPPLRLLRHRFGNAVGGEDHARAVGRFVELLDEDGAELLQPLDHGAVVDDLVAHIDRRAVFFDRELDDADGAVDARAKSPRRRQQQRQLRLRASLVMALLDRAIQPARVHARRLYRLDRPASAVTTWADHSHEVHHTRLFFRSLLGYSPASLG